MDANCTAEEDSGSVEDMAGDEMLITRFVAKGMALTWVRAWTASEDDRGVEQVLNKFWAVNGAEVNSRGWRIWSQNKHAEDMMLGGRQRT
jgi:hypothetical protein